MSEMIKKTQTGGRDVFAKGGFALRLTMEEIIFLAICYSMSFCNVFDDRIPFVISAFVAAFSMGRWGLFAPVSVVGIIKNADSGLILPYILTLFTTALLLGLLRTSRRHKAIVASLTLFVFTSVGTMFFGGYWYDVLMSALESLVCYAGIRVFEIAVPVFSVGRTRRYISDVELVSLFAIMAMVVRSLVQVPLLSGMDLSVVVAILFLFSINLSADTTAGAAMGIIFGLATWGKSLSVTSSAGAFGFASLCSGFLNRFGKWGVVLGFVFSNAVMSAFFPSDALAFDIFEVGSAAIIFSVLPPKITHFIPSLVSKTVRTPTKAFVEQDKLQTVIGKRLDNLCGSYFALADAYDKCFVSKEMSKNYIIRMFDTVSSKICPECGLKYNCWERNYKESYRAMMDMLETMDKEGVLTPETVTGVFADRCIKLKEFVNHFSRMYDLYRVERMWQQRLNDTRHLVSKQLRAISRCVSDTAKDFDMCLDLAAEKEIKVLLDKKKIDFGEITFLKGKENIFSMELSLEKSNVTKNEEETIADIVETVTGQKTLLACKSHENNTTRLTYKNTANFRVGTGFASAHKKGEQTSGDSYAICTLANGCVSAAISDGMGTGKRAATESGAAIELYRNFVMSGMDVETSLELINSSLLLRSSDDSFVTMDVCCVDLNSGGVVISKSGAASGFVKKGKKVLRIDSDSLPFGVLPHYGKVSTTKFDIQNCALIVMMSDGVYDVLCADDESVISEFISKSETDNPQLIASELLNKALDVSDGKAADDMTVIVLNVWKI